MCKLFFFNIYLFLERGETKERGREIQRERVTSIGCLLYVPQMGTELPTQACGLNENRTRDLSLYGSTSNQLSHTGQGSNSVLNFLKNLCTVFHRGCSNLHSHQQCMRIPFSPQPLLHLFLVLLIIGILIGVR